MARSINHGRLLVLAALILTVSVLAEGITVKIDAAFHNGGELNLIRGDTVVTLRHDREHRRDTIERLGIPLGSKVSAAIFDTTSNSPRFFYTTNGRFVRGGFDSSHSVPMLIYDSIDAAASRMDVEYYFKGCEFVRRLDNHWMPDSDNSMFLNLYCSPDAAWNEGHSMVVFKDGNVRKWTSGGVEPEDRFEDHYTLLSDLV